MTPSSHSVDPGTTASGPDAPGLPLFSASGPDAIVAWRADGPVTARAMLTDIETLADRLPPAGPVLNLCGDRYRFAVAFCAASLRDQTSLLPPNRTPAMIRHLRERWPDLYAVTDGDQVDDRHDASVSATGNEPVDVPTIAWQGAAITAGSGHGAGIMASDVTGRRLTDPLTVPMIAADQVAARVFTSGSTGRPMPHDKTWGRLIINVRAEARRLGVGAQRPVTLVGTVPAQHMYGFESTVLLALHNGIALHAARPFFAADIASTLAGIEGERVLVTTPFHLRNLLESGVEVPPLALIVSATAPLSAELAATAEAKLGAPLLEIYGCTEAGQLATRRTSAGEPWRTFDGVQIEARAQGWFASGGHIALPTRLADILALDDPEHFRLLGRDNDLVNIAGKRTSIAYLDHLLCSIPGVRDGAFLDPGDAISAAEGKAGRPQRLVAFFVSESLEPHDVLAALRDMTDRVFLPRPLHRVADLPRADTGKLPRNALLELAATLQRR